MCLVWPTVNFGSGGLFLEIWPNTQSGGLEDFGYLWNTDFDAVGRVIGDVGETRSTQSRFKRAGQEIV